MPYAIIKTTSAFKILLVTLVTSSFASEFREFTSPTGTKIIAKIQQANSQSVDILLKNGQIYRNVDLSRFSESDQSYIQDWIKEQEEANRRLSEDVRLTLEVSKKRDDDLNSYGNIDDREVTYKPKIRIVNHELTRSFEDVSGTIVFIGENAVTGKNMKILAKENFKISLPANGDATHYCKPFINKYDDDPSNGHAFGFKYEGYLLVLKNEKDEMTHIKSTKSTWEHNVNNILKAKTTDTYDRSFERKSLY